MTGFRTHSLSDHTILTVPGLDNSGPDHWQSHWERQSLNCRRVDMGNWRTPNRNAWVNRLNIAIRQRTGDRRAARRAAGSR